MREKERTSKSKFIGAIARTRECVSLMMGLKQDTSKIGSAPKDEGKNIYLVASANMAMREKVCYRGSFLVLFLGGRQFPTIEHGSR